MAGSTAQRALEWMKARRRRLVPIVIGIAIALMVGDLLRHDSRDVDLEISLGDRHAAVTRVAIDVLQQEDGALMRHVEQRFPSGGPPSLRTRVELPAGDYRVEVRREGEGVGETLVGALQTPADGRVRIDLREQEEAP